MTDEPQKAVRKPFKKKTKSTGEPQRRRRTVDGPVQRPAGFSLPWTRPEEETPDAHS